ncbi:hypothetical protein ACFV6Y_38775 [Streptomyces massasporeus]|uniref:hypothetical protein n=1 Tax=Streptomyces massasporeus TaxID=67324 RepID=UPI003669221D
MKINRKTIIKTIDTTLAAHEKATAKYKADVAKWQADRRDEWMLTEAPKWKALRDLITARLRSGKPITTKDAKATLSTYFEDRKPYTTEVDPPRCPVEQLTSLRAALMAIEDDAVTYASLKAMGYKDLEWVFSAAVRAGGAK